MKNLIPPEILSTLKREPVSIPDIVKYLDKNQDVSTSILCKLIGVPASRVYDYRYRQRKNSSDESLVKGVNPKGSSNSQSRYTASEKFEIVDSYNSSPEEVKSKILREYGLYTTDIQRWHEQIKEAAIDRLKTRKVRSDKKSPEQIRIEELERELKEQEKTTAKLSALIVLQKKTEEIFKRRLRD